MRSTIPFIACVLLQLPIPSNISVSSVSFISYYPREESSGALSKSLNLKSGTSLGRGLRGVLYNVFVKDVSLGPTKPYFFEPEPFKNLIL